VSTRGDNPQQAAHGHESGFFLNPGMGARSVAVIHQLSAEGGTNADSGAAFSNRLTML
jgi:hypothetical protein